MRLCIQAGAVFISVFLAASVLASQPERWPVEHAQLVDGVRSIVFPGTPGAIVVAGPTAFGVVPASASGKGIHAALVAAAMVGEGRVVLFGHTSFLDASSLTAGDEARFFGNCLAWCGKGPTPRVAIDGSRSLRDAIATWSDGTVRPSVVELGPKGLSNLEGVDVLCLGQGALKPAEVQAIRAHIARGGGLIAAATGWGWLQLNSGKGLDVHPLNQVLAGSGLVISDDTVSTLGEKDGTTPVDAWNDQLAALNATEALRVLAESKVSPEEARQAAWTATFAARSLIERTDPFLHELESLAADRQDQLVPKPKAPLKDAKALDRVLVAYRCERDERLPAADVKANPAAAFFPGAVPADAATVSGEPIVIDLSRPKWHGTGLYVPPGTVVTLRIGSAETKLGLVAQVGCHTDRLWEKPSWQRVPDVVCRVPLDKEVVEVASAFGGLLYIDNPKKSTSVCTVTVDGAVRTPRFVLGVTTPDAWRTTVRNAPGPWAELESNKVVVSVPSEEIRTLDDPTEAVKFWEAISDAHATLGGRSLERDSAWRFVADVQISAGYMHSGYPIMTHLDAAADMVSVENLRAGCWGLLHELGHNHQESDWTFAGTGEVTCNVFALHALDTICKPAPGTRGHGAVNQPPSVRKHIETGKDFAKWKSDPFLALQFYIMLEDAFGWETFKKVFAEYRDLKKDERPKNDDEKRDQWLVRFSRTCGKNLGPYFDAWGIPVTEAAKAKVADLPGWMPENWPDGKQ